MRSFVAGMCIAVLALAPVLAHAQEPPPPPPPGYAPPPPQGYAPPPPQYPPPPEYQPPPPQPYYQPPPQAYYAPPPPQFYRPAHPPNGLGLIIVGSVFLGLGLIFLGTSIPYWGDGCGGGHTCFDNPGSLDYDNAAVGLGLDVPGSIFFIMGAIFLPVGIVQNAKYNNWRKTNHVQVAPTGLKVTF